jgi:dihydroxy-acid dehydratase
VFDAKQKLQNFCETSGFGVEFSSEVIFDEVIEIMELSQPNSAMTLADSFSKQEEATQVAQKIVELTKSRLPLKKMINKKSILNASTMNGALGGSFAVTNALLEMVNEAEIDFDDQKLLSVLEKNSRAF